MILQCFTLPKPRLIPGWLTHCEKHHLPINILSFLNTVLVFYPGKKKGRHFWLFPSSGCRSETVLRSDMLVGGFWGRSFKHADPVFPPFSSSSGSHLDCEMTLRIENTCGGLPVMERKPPMQWGWQVVLNERWFRKEGCALTNGIVMHYREGVSSLWMDAFGPLFCFLPFLCPSTVGCCIKKDPARFWSSYLRLLQNH